jgi:hypothetical protein
VRTSNPTIYKFIRANKADFTSLNRVTAHYLEHTDTSKIFSISGEQQVSQKKRIRFHDSGGKTTGKSS